MLALSLAIVVSARLGAQTPPTTQPRPAAPTTKVAIMNLTYVVNNYDNFKTYKDSINAAVKPFQDQDEKYKAEATALADEAGKPQTTQNRREEIEATLKDLQRK